MPLVVIDASDLPGRPLDAAARFHSEVVPRTREALAQENDVVVVFAPADHTHRGWRLSAIQELAREAAPLRVNGVSGGGGDLAEMHAFLACAPGITGQLLCAGGKAAENR